MCTNSSWPTATQLSCHLSRSRCRQPSFRAFGGSGRRTFNEPSNQADLQMVMNGGRGVISAAAQKTAESSLPVAIAVFQENIYRAPETWAKRAYGNLIYFNEVDKGDHFAWEEPQLFSAELRAAFR